MDQVLWGGVGFIWVGRDGFNKLSYPQYNYSKSDQTEVEET